MEIGILSWLHPVSRTVVLFLIQNSIFAALVLLIVLPISYLFKKRAVYWRMGLWTLVLVRLILPPNLNHAFSGRTLMDPLLLNTIFEIQEEHLLDMGLEAEIPIPGHPERGENHSKESGTLHWEEVCFFLWIMGSSFSLALYSRRRRQFRRIISRATPVPDKDIQHILKDWKTRFRIKRQIRLVSSDRYLSPFTLGIMRPAIFLPKSCLTEKPSDLLQTIIAHETAHIRRLDDLWIHMQSIIQIVFFFHPVVWYVNSRIHLVRECICDRMVLSNEKLSAEIYGNGLLTVLKVNLFGSDHAGLVPGFGNQHKKYRIRMQNMKGTQSMNKSNTILRLGMLILLGLFLLPMAQHLQGKAEPASLTLSSESGQDKKVSLNSLKDTLNYSAFIVPVQTHPAYFVSPYGYRINPFTQKKEFHKGLDIASLKGTPVLATQDGIISKTVTESDSTGYGKYVVIQHDGDIWSVYAHLDSVTVKPEQPIRQAEVIGFIGRTGKAAGYHLHFEIRKGEKTVDPEGYIELKK